MSSPTTTRESKVADDSQLGGTNGLWRPRSRPARAVVRPTLGQPSQAPADLPRLRAQAGARNLRASDHDDPAKLAFTQVRSTEGEHAAEHEGVGEVDAAKRRRVGAPLSPLNYELDLAGNVRALRGATSGTVVGTYQYAGFGAEMTTSIPPTVDQPLRWKARWWDSYTGLYDVRARQWSPAIGSFTSIDEFVYHDRKGTLWTWPGMNPIRWRDPWGRDYESTGWEGAFLHNADMAMGMVVITTLTVMTGGLAAEVGLTGYGAAALLGGAAGWSFEGLRQMLAHEDTSVSRLVAAGGWGAVDGVMLELLLFGPSDQPRSCPVRRPTEVNLPKINAAKQGKHIVGHKNFIPGRGELTHPDPQGLLERGAGTGVPYGTKEVVDFGEIIGMYRDGAGNTSPTTRGTIHYDSQGGAHIVPARPQ